MKNYLVKALMDFNDYEGKDVNNPSNSFKERKIHETFYCTKERYEELNGKHLVVLVGIDKITDEPKETKKTTKKKK